MDLMVDKPEKVLYMITIRSQDGPLTEFKVDATDYEDAIEKTTSAMEEVHEALGMPPVKTGDVLEIMSADGVGVFALSDDGGWEAF